MARRQRLSAARDGTVSLRDGVETLPREAFATWIDGDDHALLWYRPSDAEHRDKASRLLLRFKDRYADAIDRITEYAREWVRDHEVELQARGIAYVVAAPRSAAAKPNVACERLAASLAAAFPWLTHMPNVLVRTRSIEAAHRGGMRSQSLHIETIRYEAAPLARSALLSGLRCRACDAEFANESWLQRHLASARHRLAAGDAPGPGVLVLDDVTTTGTTMAAIRHILRRDAEADAVIGLSAGRTTRDEVSPQRAGPAREWAVLFDLDGTLVDSLQLKALRDARRWEEVHASFHLSRILPGTAVMLSEVRRLATTGVVTMAPRRYAQLLLEHHGLEIPVLVGYEDVRRRKPHPDPILRAAETLGISPSRTIYVGDEVRDMVAAQRAGAFAVAFGRELGRQPEVRTASARASDWTEVVRAVRRIMQG